MEFVLFRTSAAAAVILLTMAGIANADTSPTDARSCAVRYRAVQAMFSTDKSPKSVATVDASIARARVALIKAGIMQTSAVDLPADVSDAGFAYYKGIMTGTIMSTQFLQDVRACDKAGGHPQLM